MILSDRCFVFVFLGAVALCSGKLMVAIRTGGLLVFVPRVRSAPTLLFASRFIVDNDLRAIRV